MKPRKYSSSSISRGRPGAASLRSRMREAAARGTRAQGRRIRRSAAVSGVAGRQGDPRRLAERQARFEEAAALRRASQRVSTRGPERKAARQTVGFVDQHRAGDHGRVADQETVAELQAQPVQQRLSPPPRPARRPRAPGPAARVAPPASSTLPDQRIGRRRRRAARPAGARREGACAMRPARDGVGRRAQPRQAARCSAA